MSEADYLELTAIVAAAVFGVLGTLTETKDNKKHLTLWGWAAVAGIVITNGFSLVNTYIKQHKSEQEEINRLKTEAARIAHQDSANRKQLHLQDSVIRLSNLLAKSQIDLQRHSADMLDQLGHSLELNREIQGASRQINGRMVENLATQRMLFDTMRTVNARAAQLADEQRDLISRQAEIDAHVTKSLNPLLPFAISYDLRLDTPGPVKGHTDIRLDLWYKRAYANLQSEIRLHRQLGDAAFYRQTGLLRYKTGNETRYEIRTAYKKFGDFAFLEKLEPTIELENYSEKSFTKPFRMEMGQVNQLTLAGHPKFKYLTPHIFYEDDYDPQHFTLNDIDIFYSEPSHRIIARCYTSNLAVIEDLGNISSTLDLEGRKTSLYVWIRALPTNARITAFDFFFQPNFSRRMSARTERQKNWSDEIGFALAFRDTLDFFYNRMP